MFSEGYAGWLWLIVNFGFVLLLAAALIYGVVQWRSRRRSRAVERERDAMTERLYKESNGERR